LHSGEAISCINSPPWAGIRWLVEVKIKTSIRVFSWTVSPPGTPKNRGMQEKACQVLLVQADLPLDLTKTVWSFPMRTERRTTNQLFLPRHGLKFSFHNLRHCVNTLHFLNLFWQKLDAKSFF